MVSISFDIYKRESEIIDDLEFPHLEVPSGSHNMNGYFFFFSGVQIYRKFYSEEKEKLNGVLAIGVTKPAAQPFISLAGMLSVSMLAACPYVSASY